MKALLAVLWLVGYGFGAGAPAPVVHPKTPLDGVKVTPRFGNPVPSGATFTDEAGRRVAAADWRGRPTIVSLAYYRCPNVCSLVQEGMLQGLQALASPPGRAYNLVTVSIDPREGPADAAAFKARLAKRASRPAVVAGWRFLTGTTRATEELASALGYDYVYDARQDQYAHPGGLVVLTPDGRVSRYLNGLVFEGRALRLALAEAGGGRTATVIDQVLLRCYHYDPQTGTYSFAVMTAVRAVGLLTLAALGVFWGLALRSGRRKGDA